MLPGQLQHVIVGHIKRTRSLDGSALPVINQVLRENNHCAQR